jgi:hypothetical protein
MALSVADVRMVGALASGLAPSGGKPQVRVNLPGFG